MSMGSFQTRSPHGGGGSGSGHTARDGCKQAAGVVEHSVQQRTLHAWCRRRLHPQWLRQLLKPLQMPFWRLDTNTCIFRLIVVLCAGRGRLVT